MWWNTVKASSSADRMLRDTRRLLPTPFLRSKEDGSGFHGTRLGGRRRTRSKNTRSSFACVCAGYIVSPTHSCVWPACYYKKAPRAFLLPGCGKLVTPMNRSLNFLKIQQPCGCCSRRFRYEISNHGGSALWEAILVPPPPLLTPFPELNRLRRRRI